ncbi:MAG: hypothetical protein J0H78_02770 [Rhizobiales bacterium]|nr:hypothetical protein [Hyphomicrobiales bacterium]
MSSSKPQEKNGTRPARDEQRQPFDTSDLSRLPQPNPTDPPYRPFWVSDDNGSTPEG